MAIPKQPMGSVMLELEHHPSRKAVTVRCDKVLMRLPASLLTSSLFPRYHLKHLILQPLFEAQIALPCATLA